VTLLLFAEDAGAAAFIAPLIQPLRDAGLNIRVYATATASNRLKEWGIEYHLLKSTDSAQELLSDVDLVATGTAINARTMGLALIDEARLRGIPSVGLVDSHQHMEWRFRGETLDPLAHRPDWVLLPDSAAHDHARELGFPLDGLVICGHPSLDRVRALAQDPAVTNSAQIKRRDLTNGLAEPIVLFVTEPSVNVYGGSFERDPAYTLPGRPNRKFRTDIVLDEFLDAIAKLQMPVCTVLRPHPATSDPEISAHVGLFDRLDRSADVHSLVLAADLVVGMTSILLVESVLMGRPTLSIVPRRSEAAWCSAVLAGVTPCVWTRSGLDQELAKALRTPRLPDRERVNQVYPPGAIQRIAGFFRSLVPASGARTSPS
jgi:hypothetical protein